MSKLKVTLKQHTPLIHFQSEQDGAIIRGTEFKPKLDKFLIEYAFEGTSEEKFEHYKQYLVGYKNGKTEKDFEDKKAFDYKVRFLNVKNLRPPLQIEHLNENNKEKKFPLYFGNMNKDKDRNKNKFILCDTLDVQFFSMKKQLLEKIIQVLPDFFMTYNFGQRQSKGFGSFYINDDNEYFINGEKKVYDDRKILESKKLKYKLKINKRSNNSKKKEMLYEDYKSVFSEIESFYTLLRSGGRSESSYIKKFAFQNKMTWDKAIIKKRYDKKGSTIIYDPYLIKDLLGLSIEEKWIKQRFTITKSNKEIERFQSPIFFKPIRDLENNFSVYFEAKDIPKEFLDKTFEIKKDGEGDLKLKTPKNFNVDDFIQYVIKEDKKRKIQVVK